MPISSGAEGHVGLGVDTSIRWIPDGGEDYPGTRTNDSYLKRYLLHQHAVGGNVNQEERENRHTYLEKTQNSQNKGELTKQRSNNITEQHRKDINEQHNKPSHVYSTTQEAKEASLTTPRNRPLASTTQSEKSALASSTQSKNQPFTSTNQPTNNSLVSTDGVSKKSKVCVIL